MRGIRENHGARMAAGVAWLRPELSAPKGRREGGGTSPAGNAAGAKRRRGGGAWLRRRLLADGVARHTASGKVAPAAAAWGRGCRLGPAAGWRHTRSLERGGATLGAQMRNTVASSSGWSGRTWRLSSSESRQRRAPARGETKKGV
jgi:hypothetical protein